MRTFAEAPTAALERGKSVEPLGASSFFEAEPHCLASPSSAVQSLTVTVDDVSLTSVSELRKVPAVLGADLPQLAMEQAKASPSIGRQMILLARLILARLIA
jgi:hypothetical protein